MRSRNKYLYGFSRCKDVLLEHLTPALPSWCTPSKRPPRFAYAAGTVNDGAAQNLRPLVDCTR